MSSHTRLAGADARIAAFLAYSDLQSHERTVAAAAASANMVDRLALVASARPSAESLDGVLGVLGDDAPRRLAHAAELLVDFDRRTPPSDDNEALMKLFVVETISRSLCRSAWGLDVEALPPAVQAALAREPNPEALRIIAARIAGDARTAARLSLWSRRILGEALSQAQKVLRGALADLPAEVSERELIQITQRAADEATQALHRLGIPT